MDQIRFKTTEPDKDLAEALHIMYNLRRCEEKHRTDGGSDNLKNVQYWRAKADQFLDGHRAKRVNGTKVIHS